MAIYEPLLPLLKRWSATLSKSLSENATSSSSA